MRKLVFLCLFVINIILFLIFFVTKSYPLSLVLINIISIIILSIWSFPVKAIYQAIKNNYVDLFLFFFLFLLALLIRYYRLEEITPGMWGDEVTIGIAGEQILSAGKFTPFIDINFGHPTPLLYIGGMITDLFGRTLTTVRLTSLFFGAMSIVAFYILLRLQFNRVVAFITSCVLAFSYPHLVVSRLAYEITASLFFQITSIIFLYLAFKTRKVSYYIGFGLLIGLGLYTYLGFRAFALMMLGVVIFHIVRKESYLNKLKLIILVIATIFITAVPLFSYSVQNQKAIMARTRSLSVFGQNLPSDEVRKEIQGATARLINLFFFNGDPNPRMNPSGVSLFDLGSSIIALVGLFILLKSNRNLFFLTLILWLPPIVNDVFSLERIPEFHYYGIGHPNTLRIAGIIPIIYFWFANGVYAIKRFFERLNNRYFFIFFFLFIFLIMAGNYYLYFNQQSINSRFYLYNYEFNQVRMLKVADLINKKGIKEVYVSRSFATDVRVKYFTKRGNNLKIFEPKSIEDLVIAGKSNKLTIVDPRSNVQIVQQFINEYQKKQPPFKIEIYTNPIGQIDFLVFSRRE